MSKNIFNENALAYCSFRSVSPIQVKRLRFCLAIQQLTNKFLFHPFVFGKLFFCVWAVFYSAKWPVLSNPMLSPPINKLKKETVKLIFEWVGLHPKFSHQKKWLNFLKLFLFCANYFGQLATWSISKNNGQYGLWTWEHIHDTSFSS